MGKKGRLDPGHEGIKLAVDELHVIPRRLGEGRLRLQVWTDIHDKVVRYSLAYINPAIYSGDSGRVLGYDDAHGYHHRHYFGAVEEVAFSSFEATLERFENEWRRLANGNSR